MVVNTWLNNRPRAGTIAACQQTLQQSWTPLSRVAAKNSRQESPKGPRVRSPSFVSPISCDVRQIAYVTSRLLPPETKARVGDKSGRQSVGLPHKERNIGSVQRPRNGDRRCRRWSGPEKIDAQLPGNPRDAYARAAFRRTTRLFGNEGRDVEALA